ncbi:YfiR family protein [Oligoflexia bacterium]|nr:YfiR family protein [Oligoflexia bacterium]
MASIISTDKLIKTVLTWFLAAAVLLVGLGMSGLHPSAAFAQTDAEREYGIKAGFFFNFGRYVEWPSSAFSDNRSALKYCVYGPHSFKNILEKFRERTVSGRPVSLYFINSISELDHCHLVYLSRANSGSFSEVLRTIENAPILTVTEERGRGIISLFTESNKIKMEISVARSAKAGLKISSRLLKLAVVID